MKIIGGAGGYEGLYGVGGGRGRVKGGGYYRKSLRSHHRQWMVVVAFTSQCRVFCFSFHSPYALMPPSTSPFSRGLLFHFDTEKQLNIPLPQHDAIVNRCNSLSIFIVFYLDA